MNRVTSIYASARLSIVTLLSAVLFAAPVNRTTVGLTQRGSVIESLVVQAGVAGAPTVILIGSPAAAATSYAALPDAKRSFRLHSVPEPNPEGAALQFPPRGKAYRDNSEAHYLWRWIALQAPDLVLVADEDPGGLVAALNNGIRTFGVIPARQVTAAKPLEGIDGIPASEVHKEIQRRTSRTPAEVARLLEPHYGHEFEQAVYIPAMALMARMKMGFLDDVRRIAEPYLADRESLAKPTGSHLSGHLLFADLAERTGNAEWLKVARKAADLGFNADGSMKEAMPFHSEMSDSVFMGCPILSRVGRLTGERKYFDMAVRHFRFKSKLCRRSDGLYRHSPLNEAAWGRGNAFPALGLALTLADLPESHPGYGELLASFRELMGALARLQDPATGMWRQVVDHPGAYPEFSATAMIGRSMLLGVRHGWLPANEYAPRVDAAWRAVSARISDDGQVMDVCESTGKQKSLVDYLHREALWGHDPRGGGMALMFAVDRMASR